MRAPVHSLVVAVFLFGLFSNPMLVGKSLAQGGVAMFGTGTGSGTIMCTSCTHAGNMGGSTLTMQLAVSTSPHLRVGSTLDWWWHSTDTWERGIWDLTAVVFYYPWTVRRGFFIGGGPSYSLMWATV